MHAVPIWLANLLLMGEEQLNAGEITRVIFYDVFLHISDSENYKPSQNLAQQRLENYDINVLRNIGETPNRYLNPLCKLSSSVCWYLP